MNSVPNTNASKANNSFTAAQSMSTADRVQYQYEMSLAQMASEVYGLKPGMADIDLTRTLRLGNSFPAPTHSEDDTARIGNQRLTDSQITDFKDTFTVVATSSETSATGDFAVLLERRDGTRFCLCIPQHTTGKSVTCSCGRWSFNR